MEQLMMLIMLVFFAYIWVRILGKTGNNQWLGLLMVVPIANIVLMIWLAFSEWPLERKSAGAGHDDPGQMTS